jgi:hypothetical protein
MVVVWILLGMILVLVVLGGLWFLGMRGKWPVVLDFQRKVNRRVFNPRQMRSAGTSGAYAGIVRHVGRSSGRPYETPVASRMSPLVWWGFGGGPPRGEPPA